MRRLSFMTAAVAATVVAGGLLAQFANAQSPTPTIVATASPEPTVSVSPTPTVYPQSTIIIRFVRNGQPATITQTENISRLLADGAGCLLPRPAVVGPPMQFSFYGTLWPLAPDLGLPPECSKGPPTTLRFEFRSDVGRLVAELVWTGTDVSVDLEVPAGPSTPAATPLMGAGELPTTGGTAEREDSASPLFTVSAVVLILIASAAGSTIFYRKHR